MNSKRSPHVAGFALLMTSFFFALPAFAQSSPATQLPVSQQPALKDIQIQPPVLGIFDILWPSNLQFEDKDDALLLTQPPQMWGGTKPDSKVLWAGKFGAKPQTFTLETTASEEDLKDDTGKVLWSQQFEEPSLTLDFDRRNHIRLLDSIGNELGFAPTDESFPHIYPVHHHSEPFHGKWMDSGGIRIETDTDRQQTTVTSGTQLIWSGHRPPNDGVRLGRSPESAVYGIPTRKFPVGLTITFEVTRETGSMSITDENHRLLETEPVETLHLTALCDDEKFRKSIHNWFLFSPHDATTQVDLNAPGQIYVEYHTAAGDWAGKETIHAI